MFCIHLPRVVVTNYFPSIKDHIKSLDESSLYTSLRIWFGASRSRLIFIICKPFFNPTQVNPLDVAQQNEQGFIVEEIIAHRGDHHRRSTMEFLVRWTGSDESSNSWEPYKALMHVESTGCKP
jgi:hypothetical protein